MVTAKITARLKTLFGLLNINAQAICECKNNIFMVGIETKPDGDNNIRLLVCARCGIAIAVPYSATLKTGDIDATRHEVSI